LLSRFVELLFEGGALGRELLCFSTLAPAESDWMIAESLNRGLRFKL
jgi:hypothetical protein